MRLKKNKTIYLILLFLCMLFPRICYHNEIYISNEQDVENIKNLKISDDIFIDEYFVPSVTESISSNQLIKIGLLDDLNHISGEHAWKGIILAAREVNEEGGILINGINHYVAFVAENTNEMSGTPSEGIEAAEKMINDHHPHFITGGFNTLFLEEYLEVVMDNNIPFLGTGAVGESLCQNVQDDYERYKYFFRVSPLNTTALALVIISYLIYLCYYLNNIDAGIVNKTAILRESFVFDAMAQFLKSSLPMHGISVEEDIVVPDDATSTDLLNYWSQIESKGVQVVFSMFTNLRVHLGKLISQTYQQLHPQCLVVSYAFGTLSQYWDYVEGACQFDINLQSIYNTSKTPLTIPFFTRYVNEYDIEPYYTGVGSYDAVKLLVQIVNETQGFNPKETVSALEKINIKNPFMGAGSYIAFTPSHDLKYGSSFAYPLFCQWKYIDGNKEVVPHKKLGGGGYPVGYPDSVVTGSIRLPYWGINDLLTNPPQPPGIFTINSTAEKLDLDGIFNLTWTDSEGADNYSIYLSNKPLNYISKKFDVVAYQTALSPFQLVLKKGHYYFRVVAYNKTGEIMSSNDVLVKIPGPEPFSLSSTAGNPDTDGEFELEWTQSARADNYSVFRYNNNIITINESLILLSNQTAISPRNISISGLTNGKYFFVVAAFNEMGYTLSNNVYIIVKSPFDMTFISIILIVSISSVVGVASIFLIRAYTKRKGQIKLKEIR
jgi:branched-chain amino acid transport system substrate-binding protein